MLLRGRRQALPSRYAWLNFNLAAWFIGDALFVSETLALRFAAGIQGVTAAVLPLSCVAFFATFTAGGTAFDRWVVRAAFVLSLLLLLLTVGALDGYPLEGATSLLDLEPLARAHRIALIVACGLAVGASVLMLYRRYLAADVRAEKTRLRYLTASTALVFGLALAAYVTNLGVAIFGDTLLAVFMFFMFQVISLRRVIDLFEFVGRFIVLAGFALALSLIYALLVGWWRYDFDLFLFNTVVATVVVLILLDPLRTFVERKLNEIVFRETFRFAREAEGLKGSLANVIDVGAMSDLVLTRLDESRHVTHASIYLRTEDGLALNRLGFVGVAPPATIDAIVSRAFLARLTEQRVLVIETLEAEREELITAESQGIDLRRQVEVLDRVLEVLSELEAALVVAFTSDDDLLGFLCVKDERIREAYGRADIHALAGLAAQITQTIENSRLFDRIRERDRLAAIGEMAAGLAHEIRNPLGAIKGSAQLLDEDPEQRAIYLNIINEEVRRLDKVVSQFLTYARPLKGHQRELVDVNHVLERTLTLVRADDHASTVDFVPADDLPAIRSDPELIRQVVLNISRNGIEAMAPRGGGKLTIRTGIDEVGAHSDPDVAAQRRLRIRLEDEGPGMTPEIMERLFIPFFTTKANGTGLGLAICQRIVRSLGGTIEVSSRLERGTTFTIFLPIQDTLHRATQEIVLPADRGA